MIRSGEQFSFQITTDTVQITAVTDSQNRCEARIQTERQNTRLHAIDTIIHVVF